MIIASYRSHFTSIECGYTIHGIYKPMNKFPRYLILVLAVGFSLGFVASVAYAAFTFNANSITGDSNSVLDSTGSISIGTSSATGITIGRSGMVTTFPGSVTIGGTTTTLQNLVVSGNCTGCGVGNFTAGGDLSGSASSQTVIGLQGRTVSSTAPLVNQALTWNGSVWVPMSISNTSSSGAVTTSSAILANNFPFWTATGGALSGTSTLSVSGTTVTQANAFNIGGNLNTTGTATFASTFTQSGGLASLASTTINGNATTTGNLAVLGSLLDANGNKYVTSTPGGSGPSVVYNTSSTAGNTNISAVTMVSNTSAITSYSFNWTVSLTTAGSNCTGVTTVVLNEIHTDPNASSPTTDPIGTLTLALNGNGAVGLIAEGVDHILAKSGTAVQYSTSNYTAGSGCTINPSYRVYPVLVSNGAIQ